VPQPVPEEARQPEVPDEVAGREHGEAMGCHSTAGASHDEPLMAAVHGGAPETSVARSPQVGEDPSSSGSPRRTEGVAPHRYASTATTVGIDRVELFAEGVRSWSADAWVDQPRSVR
jgi:hypothetical protein